MDILDLSNGQLGKASFADALDKICQRFEVDHAAYAGTDPVSGTLHGFANYPLAWKSYYEENNLQLIDPTLRHARRSIAPVNWERLADDHNFTRVFADAHEFGISQHGITVPVRGPYGDIGLVSLTRRDTADGWRRHLSQIIGDLQSTAVNLHDITMQSDTLARALRRPQLSGREREILQWIAVGKTQGDVADILSISSRTVEVHLRSAREKLWSMTTAQAVGRAIGYGFISPG